MRGYVYTLSANGMLTYYYQENDTGNIEADWTDPIKDPFFEFALPNDDYGDMAFARRLAPEGSQSPPTLSNPIPSGRSSTNRRQSTIDDTDGTYIMVEINKSGMSTHGKLDPRSSPASAPGQSSVRGRRAKPTGKSQLQSVSVPVTRTRRGEAPTDELEKGDEDKAGETEKDDWGRDTPANASKAAQNVSKAAKSKSNRRKSVRRR